MRSTRLLRLLLLSALVAPATLAANGTDAVLKQGFAALDTDWQDDWAYTEVRRKNDRTTIARYDPRVDPRWTLLTVNDQPPSTRELQEFREQKAQEDEAGEEKTISMVVDGSAELIEESDRYWLYRFQPADDADEDFMSHIEGRVRISKTGVWVEQIELVSRAPFRPAFTVRIDEFQSTLLFGPASDDGPIVPLSAQVFVTGKAMRAMHIEETDAVQYIDYEFVGEVKKMVPDR